MGNCGGCPLSYLNNIMVYDIKFEIGDFARTIFSGQFGNEIVKIKSITITRHGISCECWHRYGRSTPFFIRNWNIIYLERTAKPDDWDKYCIDNGHTLGDII